MVRDVIYFEIDLSKVDQRLKELYQAVSLVNLVGQYLPPLQKIDIDSFMHSGSSDQADTSQMKVSKENSPE